MSNMQNWSHLHKEEGSNLRMVTTKTQIAAAIFWWTLILGGVYGFFIALITNLIVKEKKETPAATS